MDELKYLMVLLGREGWSVRLTGRWVQPWRTRPPDASLLTCSRHDPLEGDSEQDLRILLEEVEKVSGVKEVWASVLRPLPP